MKIIGTHLLALLAATAGFSLSTLNAADQPADPREAEETRATMMAVGQLAMPAYKGGAVDWPQIKEKILSFAAKYPQSEAPAMMVRNSMYSFEMAHAPAESAAAWKAFAESPNQALATKARDKVRAFDLMAKPVDLAFNALDGSKVDFKQLRGKVVLLDFWATWCGPCIAELPTVKKVYGAYHDKGFEIVGISCDVAPNPEKKIAYAKTGPEVLEFIKANDMPWPQHYEGRKHNEGGNSLAALYAVTGIPAAFLIDQNGQIVVMNVRGEKLEKEVKRLLEMKRTDT